uniref:NoproductstringInfile n=2 Tax=Chrysanthemum TaxID=13422 RepID=A0A7U1GGB7_9ASTR|nr:noproductstringInfile [Chrysanthemum zawadskii]YP_010155113.1 noproductstringInfile [Chrysanthemum vestitum]QQX28454.1 noproductstringInfile [Chrysanthemum vestitum]QQY98695.1 noproductstringInfile [Chrysanthemum zawadskii]
MDFPNKGTLGEPPTPTTVHVRSILDLTNCPSYLLYVLDVLDSPSLSQ